MGIDREITKRTRLRMNCRQQLLYHFYLALAGWMVLSLPSGWPPYAIHTGQFFIFLSLALHRSLMMDAYPENEGRCAAPSTPETMMYAYLYNTPHTKYGTPHIKHERNYRR